MSQHFYGTKVSKLLGVWPCGHPRTPENSQSVGKAGLRCRECRQHVTREWWRKHHGFPVAAIKVTS